MNVRQIYAGILALGVAINIFALTTQVQAEEWEQSEQGWKYKDDDGIKVQNQWKQIDKKWYYFDYNGYSVCGWKELD